jgi:hypothetical protein
VWTRAAAYLEFLLQWINWPYLAALLGAALAGLTPAATEAWGRWLAHRLRLDTISGRFVYSTFALSLAFVGLTVNGAVHDFWPGALAHAFLPGLFVSGLLAAVLTRWMVRTRDRYFPAIRAVAFDTPDLAGAVGRVVSREVTPDSPAGRVQVVTPEGVLHIVRCKTRAERIRFGRRVVLLEYDERDGRYLVVSERGAVQRA